MLFFEQTEFYVRRHTQWALGNEKVGYSKFLPPDVMTSDLFALSEALNTTGINLLPNDRNIQLTSGQLIMSPFYYMCSNTYFLLQEFHYP
jgi:hypothetical protein